MKVFVVVIVIFVCFTLTMEIKNPFTGKVVFQNYELACSPKDPKAGEGYISPKALERLGLVRAYMRKPITINSSCRSDAHNLAIGGKSGSYHLYENREHGACAWDISVRGWSEEDITRLVYLAWNMGYSVGTANSFIHIDDRSYIYGKKQRFWDYEGYRGIDYQRTVFSKIARIIS